MESLKEKSVLISGASIAGLSTAYWMNRLGYKVTVIELADKPRTAGAAIDIKGMAFDISKRMGIFEQLKANRLNVEKIEFKNADDISEDSIVLNEDPESINDEIEIERDQFMNILFNKLKNDVEFIFNNSITDLNETQEKIDVSFKNDSQRSFDLVLGLRRHPFWGEKNLVW